MKDHLKSSASSRAEAIHQRQQEILAQVQTAAKPSKYRNVKTVMDGVTFDSRHEARVYMELRMREKLGEIANLTLQPRFPLVVCGVTVATYVGDFQFYQRGGIDGWTFVVADAKGMKTPVYLLKRKLMRAIHGIAITEL